ncbi:polyprenol phosphomannose-dependent alpha 1,6 mannosyltransferase MptB [Nocardioides caricicola]|uniref:Polyprenol phosphomannose-dependent alpha 1,6 mannosyltransferase MptB n=1 Tax=Nocardioides caricicola TaxID=634770 RepID=A0ABW0N365_9ACTN
MLTRGFVGSVLVLVGGLIVSTLPPSTWLMRQDLLLDLRGAEAGRMLGLTVVLVGLGILAAEWLSLCRHVALADGEDRADALHLVRYAVVVWSAPLVLAPPLFSRDGWSYAAQGMLAHLGISPYEHGPGVLRGPVVEAVDPRWMDTITPYGPVPLVAGDFAAGLTGNPWVLVVGHRLVALAGLVLLAWAVPRLAAWTDVNPALASAVVLASPLMLANGVGGLHNDLLMVGLMAAALVVAAERGWVAGAVLGGLAAAVKLPGGLVCVGVALVTLPLAAPLLQRVRRLAGVAAVSVGTLLGLGVVTGLGSGWIAGLTVPGTVTTPLSVMAMLGIRNVGTVVAGVVVVVVALRWRTGERDRALRAVALVVGVTVVLGPVVHLWYLLWVVPFLATMRLPRVAMAGLLAGSTVFGLVAPMDSSLHEAYLAIVLGSLLIALLVPLLLLTRRSRARIERIVSAEWIPAQLPQPRAGRITPVTSPSAMRPPEVPGAA